MWSNLLFIIAALSTFARAAYFLWVESGGEVFDFTMRPMDESTDFDVSTVGYIRAGQQIIDWSFNMSNPPTSRTTWNGNHTECYTHENLTMSPLVVTRHTDHHSPELFQVLAFRTGQSTVAITWANWMDEKWFPQATFEFSKAYCVTYQFEGLKGRGNSIPVERLEFSYAELQMKVQTYPTDKWEPTYYGWDQVRQESTLL